MALPSTLSSPLFSSCRLPTKPMALRITSSMSSSSFPSFRSSANYPNFRNKSLSIRSSSVSVAAGKISWFFPLTFYFLDDFLLWESMIALFSPNLWRKSNDFRHLFVDPRYYSCWIFVFRGWKRIWSVVFMCRNWILCWKFFFFSFCA